MKPILSLAALMLFSVVIFAQQPVAPSDPKEIIKAFPPARSAQMTDAQKEVELAQAQLQAAQSRLAAAQANVRLVLYATADDIDLTKQERQTCPFAQNSNGAWIFKCPAPESPVVKRPEKPPADVKPKE